MGNEMLVVFFSLPCTAGAFLFTTLSSAHTSLALTSHTRWGYFFSTCIPFRPQRRLEDFCQYALLANHRKERETISQSQRGEACTRVAEGTNMTFLQILYDALIIRNPLVSVYKLKTTHPRKSCLILRSVNEKNACPSRERYTSQNSYKHRRECDKAISGIRQCACNHFRYYSSVRYMLEFQQYCVCLNQI